MEYIALTFYAIVVLVLICISHIFSYGWKHFKDSFKL